MHLYDEDMEYEYVSKVSSKCLRLKLRIKNVHQWFYRRTQCTNHKDVLKSRKRNFALETHITFYIEYNLPQNRVIVNEL